jgi:ribosomal protein S12 methylthiotransferase
MLIYLESLGCARNQVDSETMLARLESAGLRMTEDPSAAEAIVVNTCSFIEAAADESIDTILELARYKREGRCRRLIVTGCLPERYRDPIVEALPEVDFFLGTGAYDQIVAAVQGALTAGACLLPDPDSVDGRRPIIRKPLAAHSAYLKIAEGCSRHCTYCIIPKLRGRQKSRPPETLVQEARALIAAGARELTLVAQETTAYGQDLRPPMDLAGLLTTLAGLDPNVWIRLMYGHPQSLTAGLVQTMAEHANVCAYLDIPIQHASPTVLRRMGRAYTDRDLLRLFTSLREQLPDVALRTTVLVGFPGEREEDVARLKDFIEQVRFDYLGVFAYSDAEDLPSHHLDGHVDASLAQERMERIMAVQQRISAENLARFQGRSMAVLLDEVPGGGDPWIGRTSFQAPEVDGVTWIHPSPAGPLPAPGSFIRVKVVQTLDYDLSAEAL